MWWSSSFFLVTRPQVQPSGRGKAPLLLAGVGGPQTSWGEQGEGGGRWQGNLHRLLLSPITSALWVPGSPWKLEKTVTGKGWSKKYEIGREERKKTRRW